ncbi:hypothetical protein [Caulobacter sp. NIBR2454]|uniref:hypothetical protein n=1 Tax=Caulobacter sp. NIBR2454 TaxID=3015996 RepID=UPI0022B67168|nr:hypothetical protein [Caulobacter sp. NIBR2454]
MTSPRRILALAALVAAISGDAWAASAMDLYYERTVMVAADGRCRLFTPQLRAALSSGQAQARGAALRAGASPDQIAATGRRAQAAAGRAACNSPDITLAARRVREGFEGYARLQMQRFPGEIASWTADRAISQQQAVWRLSQPASFGADRAIFGLSANVGGSRTALTAVVAFADEAQPFTARIVMRDIGKTGGAYLSRGGARAPLATRLPPRTATRAFLAQARGGAEKSLLPAGAKRGMSFRFPEAAATAIEALDPREAIAVEFLFAGPRGDVVRTAYVEVGDFAAGRAFLVR